jgi:serine phosphatase RsbU (regulator of sigma subunit)
LKRDGSHDGGKDGMDCSLIIFDKKAYRLFVSSANSFVWIVRQGKVIEISPDKMPVGKHDKQNVSFTEHELDIQVGDIIYTLTDGFPDQFGGEKGKKYMSKKLRELLLLNSHLSMSEQKKVLEQTFSGWVGDLEQIDDVTVIGVKI